MDPVSLNVNDFMKDVTRLDTSTYGVTGDRSVGAISCAVGARSVRTQRGHVDPSDTGVGRRSDRPPDPRGVVV